MSKAEIGDLIVWSAQARWSPMKFGIVYDFSRDGLPMVRTEVKRYVDGKGWVKKIGKAAASSNYLVLRRSSEYDNFKGDDAILKAVAWWESEQ